MNLSARDDHTGAPVDWWFMYKIGGKSTSSDGTSVKGDEYIYFDANAPSTGTLVMSPHRVTDGGALPATLNRIYGAAAGANPHLGWFFYNDEDPTTGTTNGNRGHTVVDMKGIDLSSLGIHIAWPEADDHAKLCISARSEQVHFVCVGDMNFTIAQRKRGGGTTAFQCEPLWERISGILRDVAPFPHVRASRPGKKNRRGKKARRGKKGHSRAVRR